jgi:hypothetical protein
MEYFRASGGNSCYAKLIGIRVPGAGEYLAYHEAFEASLYGFGLLNGFYLKAYGCKYPAQLVYFHLFREIVEQPVIRDDHL